MAERGAFPLSMSYVIEKKEFIEHLDPWLDLAG